MPKTPFQASSFPIAFLSEGGDHIEGKEEMAGTGLKPQETITHPPPQSTLPKYTNILNKRCLYAFLFF